MSSVMEDPPARPELDIFDLWARVWARRWLVIGISVLCGAVGLAYALLATPIYRAEVVIVEVHDDALGGAASLANQIGGLASIVGVNLSGINGDNNGRAVLQSRHLTEEFIRRYVPLDRIIEKAGPHRTMWYAVKEFREQILQINEDTRANTITVSVDWKDPATAARYANLYAALANELVRNRTLSEATRNITYLNDQIEKTNVVELRRVMYNLVETETKRLMLANSRSEYAFTVVDPAVVPELKFSPRRARIVIALTVIGGIFGCFVAFAFDVYERRRKSRS
jgi:uncharacterized protein involved in exopolysaccharide biosynthesis